MRLAVFAASRKWNLIRWSSVSCRFVFAADFRLVADCSRILRGGGSGKNGNDEPMKKFVTEGLAKPWEEKSEVVVVSDLAPAFARPAQSRPVPVRHGVSDHDFRRWFRA